MTESILTPVLALIVWTLIMLIWLYATRLPAMRAAKIDPNESRYTKDFSGRIPDHVRWVADNYNHLHEQPVIFYALAFYCHLTGIADGLMIWLAWGYVGIRIIHSLVQATWNHVPVRFLLFMTGSIVLGAIAVRAVLALFSA